MKGAVLSRWLGKATKHDCIVSTADDTPVPRPAIAYVHLPQYNWTNGAHRWLLRAYDRFWSSVGGAKPDVVEKMKLLANSTYREQELREIYDTDPTVLHPPIEVDAFQSDTPWDERDNTFLLIGRVAPDKQLNNGVRVVSALRERGHDVSLRIIGPIEDESFADELRRAAADVPIQLEGRVARDTLVDAITSSKYGLHLKEEGFGIVVAEMVAGGCLPFVRVNGGQTDIIPTPDLQFGSVAEAVETVDSALQSESRARELRKEIPSPTRFSTKAFKRSLIEKVGEKIR